MLNIMTSYQATMKASALMKEADNVISMYDDGYTYNVPRKAWEHANRLEALADGYRRIATALKRQEEVDALYEQLETRLLSRRR